MEKVNLNKYDIWLFDLDETLMDFSKAQKKAFKKVIKHGGLKYSKSVLNSYKEINKTYWNKLDSGEISISTLFSCRWGDFFKLYNINVDSVFYENLYIDYLISYPYVIKGATKLLKKLKEKGKKIYIVTNAVKRCQFGRINSSKIAKYLDNVFVSEEFGYNKPDVRFFEGLAKQIPNFNKEKTVLVGDRLLSDILGANNFKIDSIFINNLNEETKEDNMPTFTVYSLFELLKLID